MANWLLKTEPEDFSWDDLERVGSSVWDGVTNNLALKHMRAVAPGDRVLLYHTGKERAVVGIAGGRPRFHKAAVKLVDKVGDGFRPSIRVADKLDEVDFRLPRRVAVDGELSQLG